MQENEGRLKNVSKECNRNKGGFLTVSKIGCMKNMGCFKKEQERMWWSNSAKKYKCSSRVQTKVKEYAMCVVSKSAKNWCVKSVLWIQILMDPDPEFCQIWYFREIQFSLKTIFLLKLQHEWWIYVLNPSLFDFMFSYTVLYLHVWIRIRIGNTDPDPPSSWFNTDPDPQHCVECKFVFKSLPV